MDLHPRRVGGEIDAGDPAWSSSMTTETRSATVMIELHAASPGAVPDWVHLVPAGTFSGADGRGPYVLDDPAAVIAAFDVRRKAVLDECHSTDRAAPEGRPAPARGWIVEMQSRADGIWGRVDWTEGGRQLMVDHAYRGISPVLIVTKSAPHRVIRIERASLTNDPNLTDLSSLHAKGFEMKFSKELLQRLGLAEDADEAAITAAIGKALDQVETHSKTFAAIVAATGAPKDAKGDQLVSHLSSVAKKAVDAGDVGEMRATIVELQSKLDKEVGTRTRDRAESFIDKAIAEGKPIKALRDHYIARHQKDPEGVEKELKALVSVHSGGIVDPERRAKTATCTSSDPREIQRAAELHQKEHGGSYEDAVLTVTGRI